MMQVSLTANELSALRGYLTKREKDELDKLLLTTVTHWRDIARANQLPPEGNWRIWLLLAGRGFGKTRSIVEYAKQCARTLPGSRGALVGATAADTRDVLVLGESGILETSSADRPVYYPSKRLVVWANGSQAMLFSADEPDRLRGLQHHWAIADELAAWRRMAAWDMLLMTMRLGNDPRVAVATTPRPLPVIKALLKDETVVVTRGTTYDNAANLAPPFLNDLMRRYEGTRLGRQELNAELIDDNPDALWTRATLDADRVFDIPSMQRILVAIDPAVSNTETSDETGIVVAGLGDDGHGYILDDMTLKASPDGWARTAIAAYHKYKADRVIAETNNGGDMVEATVRTVDSAVPFKQVRATRGKLTRAEPIAALYEQHKVHHVGFFPLLEDQLCQWSPSSQKSPDRLDAMVWALTELMLGEQSLVGAGTADEWLTNYRG